MIFSAAVTVLLLALIIYALLQKHDFPLVGRVAPLVALLGIYVVWFPESTSHAAEWVGIGRGVDLMLYIWILVSGLLILVLHLKLIIHERRLTELARYVAIANAMQPSAPAPNETRTGSRLSASTDSLPNAASPESQPLLR